MIKRSYICIQTDVICLGGFVAFLCVWVFVAIIGLHNGNIDRVSQYSSILSKPDKI